MNNLAEHILLGDFYQWGKDAKGKIRIRTVGIDLER